MLRNISVAAFALLIVLLSCLPALSATQLEDIRFETISANEERVIFRLTGPVIPNSFPMKDGSPRMVFDFNNTSVGKRIRNTLETRGTLIQRIRVGIHDSKTRVVLDLAPGRQTRSFKESGANGNLLTVVVHDARVQPEPRKTVANTGTIWTPSAEKKPEVKPAVRLPEEKQAQTAAVQSTPPVKEQQEPVKPRAAAPSATDTVLSSVLFEKNSNRGEMVMFRLNKFHPPVVFGLEEKKPRVVCDFQDTMAGERLPESLNADGKYVRGIRIERDEVGRKIRVVLDLAPSNSYDLQQVFFKNDNLFVLIINTLGNPAKKLN
ncbi:AMIN domain-containing protein [Candidatus Electronema sp. PJ]|uniref:AMIN domain-containing protein n=1 Tax=Candidatus Electronema sp. PJ TaxID=3401572 RepID=UPI003AA8F90F